MENKKNKIPLKSKLSFLAILLVILAPLMFVFFDVNITRELVILFWILLSLNFIFLIITTISRLSNDFLIVKYYNYLFYKLYDYKLDIKDNADFVDSIYLFFKDKKDEIDFKKEKIHLKEIVDSSHEISAFPLLSLTFTVLYALSIYNNDANTNIVNLTNDLIFIVLDLVLLFTFIYIFALTYLKTKISLSKVCLNIIEEYELDK